MRMITRALKRNLLWALTKSRQAKKRAREIWCWLCEQKHEEKAERECFHDNCNLHVCPQPFITRLLLRLSILTESLVQASWNDEDKSSLVLSDAFNKTIRCSLMHEPALLCREPLIALGNLAQINDKSKKNKGKESISCLFLWPSCPTSFACVE